MDRDQLIEKIARAIAGSMAKDTAAGVEIGSNVMFDNAARTVIALVERRAVIVPREATPFMKTAGYYACATDLGPNSSIEDMAPVWRAMVDAAE